MFIIEIYKIETFYSDFYFPKMHLEHHLWNVRMQQVSFEPENIILNGSHDPQKFCDKTAVLLSYQKC